MTLRCFIALSFIIGRWIFVHTVFTVRYVISLSSWSKTQVFPPCSRSKIPWLNDLTQCQVIGWSAEKDFQLIIICVYVYVSWWSHDGEGVIWECNCVCGIVGAVLPCVHCTLKCTASWWLIIHKSPTLLNWPVLYASSILYDSALIKLLQGVHANKALLGMKGLYDPKAYYLSIF